MPTHDQELPPPTYSRKPSRQCNTFNNPSPRWATHDDRPPSTPSAPHLAIPRPPPTERLLLPRFDVVPLPGREAVPLRATLPCSENRRLPYGATDRRPKTRESKLNSVRRSREPTKKSAAARCRAAPRRV